MIKLIKIIFSFLLFLITACSTLPKALQPVSNASRAKDQSISVASHGWHTSVIIEKAKLVALVPQLNERFSKSRYLEISWGDAGFYQAKQITTGLTLQAVFWPTETVLHVVGFNDHPKKYFSASKVISIKISDQGYENLLKFIKSSFAFDPAGSIIETKKGIYGNSQFYCAIGKYYAFNTCNKWTAKALYSAGVNISTWFKLTSGSVINTLEEIEYDMLEDIKSD